MFNAKFISRSSGVSENGKEWWNLELIATTADGGAKIMPYKASFCTKAAFEGSLGLAPMQDCKVACGVSQYGYLTITGIRGV